VAGFASGALERGTAGDHPDIAYSWYVSWLEWLRDSGHTFFGPLVAIGEVAIGIALVRPPQAGTPWHRGELFDRSARGRQPQVS